MTANEMQVHIIRLARDGRPVSATRIRYQGALAYRYWTRRGINHYPSTFACLVACEIQAIVEDHDFTTKSNYWKEPVEWHT